MAEYSKEKLFYLKLNKEFFDQHYIKILETQDNGDKYILFLVKLMCESISHNGYLRFNESIPYDEKMLAAITRTNIDIVRVAIKLFESMGIIEFTKDKTLFIPVVQLLTCSTTEGAIKKQEQRDRALTMRTKGGQMSTPDIEQNDDKVLEETREEKVVHMSSKEEHMSTRDESIEFRDKRLNNDEEEDNISLTRENDFSGIDYLDKEANALIENELVNPDFDFDLFTKWITMANISSKNNPSAYFTKLFKDMIQRKSFKRTMSEEEQKELIRIAKTTWLDKSDD